MGRPVAFVHVNVIPMDEERVLPDQTVVVRDGLVERVEASQPPPADAEVIDGNGWYLMPGLTDMHVHIEGADELPLYLANGVTTVRNMWGSTGLKRLLGAPDHLKLRDAARPLSPAIYTAGPIMEGAPPTSPLMPVFRSPARAAAAVERQAAAGYDFIKVYDNLSPAVYAAVLVAARRVKLPVVGHVPKQVPLADVLTGGQRTIEHLTGYIDPDAAAGLAGEALLQAARLTREAGVWNVPTLGIYQKLVPPERVGELEQQPGMEFVPPRLRRIWRLFWPMMRRGITYSGADYAERIGALYRQVTRTLHAEGARLCLGTDAPNPYVVPGFSVHDELRYLIEAGLSPFEALAAATRNAAECLGRQAEFGTVAPGLRADLLLLTANPLTDVAHAARRAGVMLRGRWLPEAELQAMLKGGRRRGDLHDSGGRADR
ncbi:MAG TPA: amidohydrolase family protein [Symbiobacteriaceae bacterium]|nr:amidohydrolase family protein [Symbiobacteriaceae bacterium]